MLPKCICCLYLDTNINACSPVVPRPPRRCEVNTDCSENNACILTLCANPCLTSNPCATSATCKPYNKLAFCFCPANHTGDPYVQCLPSPESRE